MQSSFYKLNWKEVTIEHKDEHERYCLQYLLKEIEYKNRHYAKSLATV